MLVAKDFRDKARASLAGKWGLAIGTGLLASILGAGTIFLNSGSGSSSSGSVDAETLETLASETPQEVLMIFGAVMAVFIGMALLWTLVLFIIGGPITLGYVKFNLGLVDGKEVALEDLFSQFKTRFGAGFLMQFLRNLYISLWMLLLLVPCFIIGIIMAVVDGGVGASSDMIATGLLIGALVALIPAIIVGTVIEYGYTMAPYILYENPDMSANQAIKASKELMKGNKWRLFCLCISFIGWSLLSLCTCGIGSLWLRPYQEAAYAAFYREITAEKYGRTAQDIHVEANTYNPYEEGSIL